jgi:hypothetical protein
VRAELSWAIKSSINSKSKIRDKKIFDDKELMSEVTIRKFRIVQTKGDRRVELKFRTHKNTKLT